MSSSIFIMKMFPMFPDLCHSPVSHDVDRNLDRMCAMKYAHDGIVYFCFGHIIIIYFLCDDISEYDIMDSKVLSIIVPCVSIPWR